MGVSDRIKTAMDMAERFHEGQYRTGATGKVPYYQEHILGVYGILKDEFDVQDEDILIMALLHDTVEDTQCTYDDIEKAFGPDIMNQVKLLTRIDGEPFSIYARRLFANGDYRTFLVKLADRLHTLRTIVYMPDRRWIMKKVRQTYTDILTPIHEKIKGEKSPYRDTMKRLADCIEDQAEYVTRYLETYQ